MTRAPLWVLSVFLVPVPVVLLLVQSVHRLYGWAGAVPLMLLIVLLALFMRRLLEAPLRTKLRLLGDVRPTAAATLHDPYPQ